MSRYIIDIHSRAARDPRRSGGKGAGVNRLAAQGFDVPPGFVITTAAHRGFVAGLKPQDRPAATSQPQALSDAVLAAPIPSAIRDAILRAQRPAA